MSEAEKEKAYRRIRQSRGDTSQGEANPSGGFEPPTTAGIEEIFGEIRRLAKEHSILLPPPFLPESLPRLPERSRSNNAVENMRKLPKVEEVKEEPQLVCPQCRTHVPMSSRFCLACGVSLTQEDQTCEKESSYKQEGVSHYDVVEVKPRKLKK